MAGKLLIIIGIENYITHLFSNSLTHSLTFTHTLTHTLTRSLVRSLTPSLIPSLTPWTLTHSLAYSLAHSSVDRLAQSPPVRSYLIANSSYKLFLKVTCTVTCSAAQSVNSVDCRIQTKSRWQSTCDRRSGRSEGHPPTSKDLIVYDATETNIWAVW